MPTTPSDSRPGRIWYVVAAALGAAGIGAMVALVFHVITQADSVEQFLVPGKHEYVVAKPGTQVIWNDHRTVFQGRAYDVPRRLPDGLRISVTEVAGGRPVEVNSGHKATSSTGEAERVAIASFEAPVPGRYEVSVEGELGPRVFSVGPDFLPKMFAAILGAVSAMLFGLTAAAGLALWTFFMRHPGVFAVKASASGGAPAAAPVAPVTRTPEQRARELATIVYAMQAASFILVFSIVAGVIVNYVTREQAAGTLAESHYRWQVRTFWWWLVWALAGFALAFVLVGFVIWLADAIWLIYRIVKGWVRLSEGKPMYEQR